MEYYKKQQLNDKAPLADRREAREALFNACKGLDSSNENEANLRYNIDNLMSGNYGYESYDILLRDMVNKRMNRNALVFQMIAAYEYQCPQRFTNEVYNKLNEKEKFTLNAIISEEIEEFLESHEEYYKEKATA